MIEYKKTGKTGSYVLLIHGFCEWIGYWDDLVEVLSKTNQCISISIPGYGESPSIEPYTLENIALKIHQLITELKIEKLSLIGHSMGGYISLAYCALFSEKIEKLIMLNSTAYADGEEKKNQRIKTINYLKEHGVEAFITPFVPPLFYIKNRTNCIKIIEDLTNEGIKISQNTIENCSLAMKDRPDRSKVLLESAFPVLYIIGKNDGSVKFEDSLSQCHLAKECHVLILDEAGHQCLYEKKEAVTKSIKNFLS